MQTLTQSLDPSEQRYYGPLDWAVNLLNTSSSEAIQSITVTQSAQAALDNHDQLADEIIGGQKTIHKFTGGQVGTVYPWIITAPTQDSANREQTRQRTINIDVSIKELKTWTVEKDQDEVLIYVVKLAEFLADVGGLFEGDNQRITNAIWTEPANAAADGLTGADAKNSDNALEITFAGGDDGNIYIWSVLFDTVGDSGRTTKIRQRIQLTVAKQ